jgi:hypothetical protein
MLMVVAVVIIPFMRRIHLLPASGYPSAQAQKADPDLPIRSLPEPLRWRVPDRPQKKMTPGLGIRKVEEKDEAKGRYERGGPVRRAGGLRK